MRLLTFVVILLQQVSCKNLTPQNALVSHGIKQILQDFFAKTSPKVDVVYASNEKSFKSEKLIDAILSQKNDSLAFKVKKYENIKSVIKLNSSSIVIFGASESFRKMCNEITWQTNPTVRFQHLIYIQDATLNDLELIRAQNFSIDNVNFIMHETKESIGLVSSFMFTPQACWTNMFQTINRFNESSMKWDTSNFYPNKYRNVQRCELSIRRSGLLRLISISFAKYVNATLFSLSQTKVNGTTELEIFIGQNGENNTLNSKEKYVFGYTFLFDSMVFYIPPGELYSSLEKMVLPFDKEVWIAVIVTLSIAFLSIQIVNRFSRKVKKFVFGRSVSTPTMNMIDIILNGGQVQTAGRNFARFIFILFVLWCFIIRTCYQSKMFENLQNDVRKPEVQSIDELFEKNFTFFYTDAYYQTMIQELSKSEAK